jgi:hypothetical protein
LVEEQVFSAVVLVNTVNVRLTFQGAGEAKGVHAIFTLAHLLLVDQFSLFENCPVIGSQDASGTHTRLGDVDVEGVKGDEEAHICHHCAGSKLYAKFGVRGAAIDKFPGCYVLWANCSCGTEGNADPNSQNKNGC